MRVVSVVGYRDAGKTTVIERLVGELGEETQVATVKSIHHDTEIDTPGKDTYRHRDAGADTVVGLTPSTTFEITTEGKADGVELDSILAGLLAEGHEFVIVEGFKEVSLPTILVGEIGENDVAGDPIGRVPSGWNGNIEEIIDAVRSVPPI